MDVDQSNEESKDVDSNLDLDGVIMKLKDNVCNRTIDVNFRMTILKCMNGILRHNPEKSKEMAESLYESLKDYD